MSLRNRLLKFFFDYEENEPANKAPLVNLPVAQRTLITPYWNGQWTRPYSDNDLRMQRHVGRSPLGFHAGIEVSIHRAMYPIVWGAALATPEEARVEADDLQRRRLYESDGREWEENCVTDSIEAVPKEFQEKGC